MVQISSFGLGFLFTNIFLLSLSLLYVIDFKYRTARNLVYFSSLALGGAVLLLFLLLLIYTVKVIINTFFVGFDKNAIYRALIFGIMWGIILFPFVADKVRELVIKLLYNRG